jgi:hypothetical protein
MFGDILPCFVDFAASSLSSVGYKHMKSKMRDSRPLLFIGSQLRHDPAA